MRITKLLSNLKYGSRKEIKEYIKKRYIKVDGSLIETDVDINPLVSDIFINKEKVNYFEEVNIALYKPAGYVSANKDNIHETLISLIKEPYSRYDLKIAGRLDIDASGLVILSTSGKLVHEITSPNSKKEKVYEVTLKEELKNYEKLLEGVMIKDKDDKLFLAKAVKIEKLSNNMALLTITEGKYHQVKRMFKALNNEVVVLKRIKIGNLELGSLKQGEYKLFSKEDLL